MPQPPFKVTRKMQRKVMRLVASGMGERGIAHVTGVCRETLRAHFAHELEVGRATMEAEIIDLLWTAADDGNVSAMKYLDQRATGETMPKSLRTLGKKEMQLEAAKNAGGDEWGDLLKVEPAVKAN